MTRNSFVANAALATFRERLRIGFAAARLTNRHNAQGAESAFRNVVSDACACMLENLERLEALADRVAESEPFDAVQIIAEPNETPDA